MDEGYGEQRHGGRVGEGHVAVRFGDTGKVRVFLDGQDVTSDVDEAIAGDPGQVWMLQAEGWSPGEPLFRRIKGRVEVQSRSE